ncbi:hypothetical protein KHA94_08635 [Bacillus sp. FJAT-49705]|uniref:Flagellar hook-length control protein FliK n=1 Tax=Cytobacillus citreus TaxID=2833586 RepID=A0ABS5NS45_9BACI|nr:hypothetical protein [Cytobacillus citreus]MBS4190268.1 hypothetical protein [Cytobacillus citreus]
MQVNNLLLGQQLQIIEGFSAIRAGEVAQALIKERFDHHKATVLIKGQEYTAKFEGNIPSNDRIFVEVVGFDEKGQAILKPISQNMTSDSNQNKLINDLMVKMGLDPASHPELRDAIHYLSNKGYSLDKDDVAALQKFLQKGSGSYEDKFSSIKALAQRNLEITTTNLSAIHNALNGKSAANVLLDYLEGLNFTLEQDIDEQLPFLNKKEQTNQPLNSVKENLVLDTNMDESEFNRTQASSQNVEKFNDLQPEQASISSDVKEESQQDLKTNSPITLSQSEQALINDIVQPLRLDSKNILVTEITKKLSQMAIDFKKVKQDAVKYLDHVHRSLEGNNTNNPHQVKQLLETTINKLDNAILKGNYMLYTDMSTEKDLLSASSQLAKAKDLLTAGNFAGASQIVKEVKTVLNNIQFKPSNTKMMHFVSEQGLLQKEMESPKQLLTELQQAIKPISAQEQSARQVLETVKRLGLTHENQAAHVLMGSSKGEVESNLKMSLMKMIQREDGNPRTVQSIEQALTNLTGQQLLNKSDSTSMQQLFMQLPVLLNDKNENVKVFINSQKKGKGIDWENCSLYFVLETKKLGNLGILVNATNRNLSITLKNDHEQFAEKADPFTEESIQRLNEIGYKVGKIQFKPFEEQVKERSKATTLPSESAPTQSSSEGGYDFKV